MTEGLPAVLDLLSADCHASQAALNSWERSPTFRGRGLEPWWSAVRASVAAPACRPGHLSHIPPILDDVSPTPSLGDVLELDDHTLLVLGQALDVSHDQPDVGNALVHRSHDTLFLIDTGVTTAFRHAVLGAIDRSGSGRGLSC